MPAMRAGEGRIFAPRLWGGRRFRDGCVGERIWCPGACLGLAAGVILLQHSLVGAAVVVQPFRSIVLRQGGKHGTRVKKYYLRAEARDGAKRAQLKQGRGMGEVLGA